MEKYRIFCYLRKVIFGDKIPVFSEPILDMDSKLQNSDSQSKVKYTIKKSSPYNKNKILAKFSSSVPMYIIYYIIVNGIR